MARTSSAVASREILPIQIVGISSRRCARVTRYTPNRIRPISTAFHVSMTDDKVFTQAMDKRGY
jgi:hypothetical protein